MGGWVDVDECVYRERERERERERVLEECNLKKC